MSAKYVPVERFEMTHIKNDAIAFGDGPFIKRILANDFEKAIRVGAGFQNGVAELINRGNFALCSHGLCLREGRESATRNQMRGNALLANGMGQKMGL